MKSFWVLAGWAALLDGLSKDWATVHAPFIAYNTAPGRYGLSATVTALITIGVFLALVYTVFRNHKRVPGLATAAGVMVGGCIGNFVSVHTGPPGVLDFIPFGGYSLGNLADIWLMSGAVWVIGVVIVAMARERQSARGL
jgi:lipoprotein signal peptidase